MPQPYSKFRNRGTIFLSNGNDSPSNHRPELALLAMNVIADFSILENFVRNTFVALIGSNPSVSTAIFSSIRNQAGQRDAIDVAARARFKDQPLLRGVTLAAFKVCHQADAVRNKIAHWVWGHETNIPDGVLLADPIAMSLHQAELIDFMAKAQTGGNRPGSFPQIDHSAIFIYRESDFTDAINTIARARTLISTLGHLLRRNPNNAPTDDDVALIDLSNEPEIRRILRKEKRDFSGSDRNG